MTLLPDGRPDVLDHELSRRLPSLARQAVLSGDGAVGSSKQLEDDPWVSSVFSLPRAARVLPRLAKTEESLWQDQLNAEFDKERSLLFAKISSIAYCADVPVMATWNCTRCNEVKDFTPHTVVYDLKWDVLGYSGYHKQMNAIVVSFRGTDSTNWGNWVENLRSYRMNKLYPVPGFPRAMVHVGFHMLWTQSDLQANITASVEALLKAHPGARLYVTGHSMGGALANLAALDLKFKYNFTYVGVWTYGAPRVGNFDYYSLFETVVDESWRFTHNRDVVPSLPPQLMGFHHTAREVWLVDATGPGGTEIDQKVLMCDDSGEDPSCHDSACMMGLCTSVADHLDYLGIHMYRDDTEC